jgi:hypothetical protein
VLKPIARQENVFIAAATEDARLCMYVCEFRRKVLPTFVQEVLVSAILNEHKIQTPSLA